MSSVSPAGRRTIDLLRGAGTPNWLPERLMVTVSAALACSRLGDNEGAIEAKFSAFAAPASPAQIVSATMTVRAAAKAPGERTPVMSICGKCIC